MAELEPVDGTDFYLWKYVPSLEAAVLFIALFTIVNSAHCWLMIRSRTWFCIAVAIGGLLQVIGYATRVFCRYHTNEIAPYAIQSSLVVLAPLFYSASIYMMLGRLIRSLDAERFSVIRSTKMTKIFVWGDFITLNVQGNGAGLVSSTSDVVKMAGTYVVVAGLFLQLFMFGFFLYCAIVFHQRLSRDRQALPAHSMRVPWRQGLVMIYACSILIVVRSIFRIVEYIMGPGGWLLSHEWPTYTFDAALMCTVQILFVIWFPNKSRVEKDDLNAGEHVHLDDRNVSK